MVVSRRDFLGMLKRFFNVAKEVQDFEETCARGLRVKGADYKKRWWVPATAEGFLVENGYGDFGSISLLFLSLEFT